MPVPNTITDLSVNEGANHPLGTENVGSPGSVDNYFRSIQAIIRQESMIKSWEIRGDVVTFVSTTSFSMPGDQTLWYKVPRKVQARVAAGSVFGEITASAYNGIVTTVTIAPDAGVLDVSLSAVWLGVDPQAISLPPAVVTDGLGYTPVNKAGDTMGGPLLQATAPATDDALANKAYVDSKVSSSGVTSFNTRSGAVTLIDADIAGLGAVDFTGHINGTTGVFTGGLRSLYYAPFLYANTIGGTTTLSMFNGQEQNLGLVANTIITSIDNMVGGSIMRVIFNNTHLHTVTWPANLYWPMGVTPDLAAGPNHVALVTIHYAGSGSGSGITQGGSIVGQALMY